MASDRPRLNRIAYEYLKEAVHKHCRENAGQDAVRPLILQRLERSRLQTGEPLTYDELKLLVSELINFDDGIIRKAAKLNGKRAKSGGGTRRLGTGIGKWVAVGSVGLVALVWVANLPFPPIRWTVARVTPIVLLPSFFSMDHHYRGAIASTEQADQLVNKATSVEDLALGAQKLEDAQGHLDNIPVWFLGYYPRAYCTFVGCQWRFTYDEFQQTRKLVARTEAVVFQEQNAQTKLQEGIEAVEAGKAAVTGATDFPARTAGIAQWQAGIDQLKEIPPNTLAHTQLGPKLEAYTRDLQTVSQNAGSVQVTGDKLAIAQRYAWEAAKMAQHGPHPAETWEQVVKLRQSAVQRLKQMQPSDANYRDAQLKLVEYERDLGIAEKKVTLERRSNQALQQAKQAIAQWQTRASKNPSDPALVGTLNNIINKLDQVKPNTVASGEAQQLRKQAEAKLKSVQ
ncbi:MAG: hypothetical protein ACFCA4_09650 [Cyanophyceae cyanobacterium]